MSYLEILIRRLKPELKLLGYAMVFFLVTLVVGNL